MNAHSRNLELFNRARRVIPGGVNSPVRAFAAVGGTPPFIARGSGAAIWDEEGKRYIDYVGSWGPLILGHADPDVLAAVQKAAAQGLSFGAPTAAEVELAEVLTGWLPSMDQVRLTSSGTEATMSAIRLARGATGRDLLVKFEGCYHGHADSLLVKAGSGMLTLGHPSSAGVPAALAQHTLVLPYNDSERVEAVFRAQGDQIAAVIVEPVAGNMNLIMPQSGFLEGLRQLCTQYGALLIFDEVMTGFRVGAHSAQGLYGITPDLTTLGKVIGGGLPLGAFGGRAQIMAHVAPLGAVYQAGTLSGNPLSVAAGLATLKKIGQAGFFDRLSARAHQLCTGLEAQARRHQVPFCAQHVGGLLGIYFSATVPTTYAQVSASDVHAFGCFFQTMLDHGIYLAPSAFEAGFISDAHKEAELEATLAAADAAFAAVAVQN
jgi:glutamate-1-semialdehyde 2,1-aminomutase